MQFKKHTDSVIIQGKGGTKHMIPNIRNYKNLPRWTLNNDYSETMSDTENLHFEPHKPLHHKDEEIHNNFKENCTNYKKENLQIVRYDDFPLTEITEKFKANFFRNCIAYEIALALYLGYNIIYLYGVDMFGNPIEGNIEKLSVEFWLGVAKGIGVKVIRPNRGTLFRTKTPAFYYNFINGVRIGEGKPTNKSYLYDIKDLYK